MKKINHQYLFRYRLLLLIPVCAVLIIVVLWLSGWFDEMIHIGEGYQGGDETSENGMFFENMKGEENSVSVEFSAIEGSAAIMIYDTNASPEELFAYPPYPSYFQTIENSTVVEEIVVTEPGITSFEMHQFPLNRFYFVTVIGEGTSQYEYMMSFSNRRSRIRNIVIEIFGAENLYGKTIQEYLFPFLSE